MFRTRFGNAARSPAFTMRMKPASTTVSTPADLRISMHSFSAAPSSLVLNGEQSRWRHSIPWRRARSSIFASATSDMTMAISASSSPLAIASTIDCMFDPAPEPSTPNLSPDIDLPPCRAARARL